MNLTDSIKNIKQWINDCEIAYKKEINGLKEALSALRKINTICETCRGEGKTLRQRSCAEDYRVDKNNPDDWVECFDCDGTGKINTEVKQ